MNVYRITLTSWTASFRYPNLLSGYQPTLPVPPLSTIYGLISAAMGKYYWKDSVKIGYYFKYTSLCVDLETIYQTGSSLTGIRSNVIKREFMVDNKLYLYTTEDEIAAAFRKPYFQLLIGRSGDLATVIDLKKIDCKELNELNHVKGTIVPFQPHMLPAPIQALPGCFSDTVPRRNIGTKPYSLLDHTYRQTQPIKASGIDDPDLYSKKEGNEKIEIYWQE
jgi:CRISPR-associated protein Cas5t